MKSVKGRSFGSPNSPLRVMYQQYNYPACGSTNLVEKGCTFCGKARRNCKRCGRQFVQMRTYEPLANDNKRRIELTPAERIFPEAICRVMEAEPHQLDTYMDELYEEIPKDLACSLDFFIPLRNKF